MHNTRLKTEELDDTLYLIYYLFILKSLLVLAASQLETSV